MEITEEMIKAYDEFTDSRIRAAMLSNEILIQPEKIKKSLPLAKLKLNGLQMNIITLLTREGSLTVGEIAKREGVHQQAVSKPVIALAKMNLVKRYQKENDFRSVYVELTDHAKDVQRQQRELLRGYLIPKIFSVIDIEELKKMTEHYQNFTELLKRLKTLQQSEK